MGVREDYAGLGQMPGRSSPQPKQPEYVIVGYGSGGEPMVRPGPGVSDLTSGLAISELGTNPIPLSRFKQFLETSKTHAFNKFASPIMNSPAGVAAGMMLPGPRGMGGLPGPAGGPVATRGPSSVGPALTPPAGGGARVVPPTRLPWASDARAIPEARLPNAGPQPGALATRPPQQSIPTYTPEVVPGPTDLRAFSGRVTDMPRRTPALSGPAPALPAPTAQRAGAPSAWTGMEPGGMSGGQVSQMDAAAAGIANAFNQTAKVPTWAKAAGGLAAGAGVAGLAGYNSGKDSLQSQPPQSGADPQASAPPQFSGQDPQAMSFMPGQGKSMALPQPGMSQQPTAPTTGPQRGPTRPMGGHRIAGGGAAQGVAGAGGAPGQQSGGGFAIGQNPRAPAANYYSDMLGAADSGDAYARDLVNLTSQARQVAYKANQEGKHLQFVPLHDMRNNRLYLVNANGQDVVLDMNDEGDKAAFGRMTAKIGMDPASIMAWAQSSSRPLHRYMVPPGSQGDWAPQFAEPGSQAPQVGAQPPVAQEPTASPAPFEIPQVPRFNAGQPLPTMRGLDIGADRPVDANMAEIDMLRGQGLGGPQLDETERRLREQRANNPAAYARPQRG